MNHHNEDVTPFPSLLAFYTIVAFLIAIAVSPLSHASCLFEPETRPRLSSSCESSIFAAGFMQMPVASPTILRYLHLSRLNTHLSANVCALKICGLLDTEGRAAQ